MKRISIKIHPASLVLLAAVFLFADSHLALAALLALTLHEGAHLLAFVLCKIEGCRIEITPFGGMMDARTFERHPPWKQMLVSASGVCASGFAAWFCWYWLPDTLFIQRFFQVNLSLVFLNILPLWPLDGARVITAAAAYLKIDRPVKRLLAFLSVVFGMLVVIIGLYGVWRGIVNPTLLAAGPYLCYASRLEMATARVRRLGSVEHKLSGGELLPVSIWVGNEENLPEQFVSRLSQGGENNYQILIAVNPNNGNIQKWWTEQEMLHYLLSNTEIDTLKSVDKANGL